MDIKQIIGYGLSVLGLAGIALSSQKGKEIVPILEKIPTSALIIVSGVLVALGIVVVIISNKESTINHKEVPIYEGKGKNRHIVGYQRMSK